MATGGIVSSCCLYFLKFSLKEASFVGALPFKWTAETRQTELHGQVRGRYALFSAAATPLLPLLVFYRLIYWILFEYDGSDRSANLGLISVFGGSVWLFNALISWHTQNNYREHRLFVNAALNFFHAVPREFGSGRKRNGPTGCENYLKIFTVFLHCCFVFYTFGILVEKPERPASMMSLFDHPKQRLFFWPFTAFNAYLILAGDTIVQYFSAVNAIYICAMDKAMGHVRTAIEDGTTTQETFMRFYRTAQVLQRAYNQLFGAWILPAQHNVIITVVIIAVYGAVAMEGHRMIYFMVSVYQLSYLSFLCIQMGKLHESSVGLLDSVMRATGARRRHNWFQKFHKSCRPIVVTHGHLFHVDKALILVVWDTIFSQAASLLVMYG